MNYPGRTIKLGEGDRPVVKAVRRRLKELGYGVGPLDADFDAALVATVKLFQTRNVDHRGRNLVPDGQVGPLTWNALFEQVPVAVSRMASPLAQRAVELARAHIGVREHPRNSNRGPEVEKFLRAVRLGPGHAWCAAFVYWCLQQASEDLGVTNPCFCHGGVLRQWEHAVQHGLPRVSAGAARNDPSLVLPGMVFVIDYGRGLGHTGFVARVQGAHLDTIEGNTDASRTREGGGVYPLVRKVGEINKGYVLYG